MIEQSYNFIANPYEDNINVIFTDDIKRSITDQCKRLKINPKPYLPIGAGAVVCQVKEKNYRGTWCLFDVNKYNPGIVVHETVHLSYNILNPRGLKLNNHTEEAFAYLQQFIFNQITDFYDHFINN